MSDDEGTGDEEDTPEEPPSKQAKLTGFENENSTNYSESKWSKLKSLFNDNIDQGPKVNENLAATVNKGISSNFNIKAALEFGDTFKPPENCEFLRVQILNKELFF